MRRSASFKGSELVKVERIPPDEAATHILGSILVADSMGVARIARILRSLLESCEERTVVN